MLKTVIDFITSRTALNRADALREINYAWKEIWSSDDMPDSLFEVTVLVDVATSRVSLPWYVGEIRGVRMNTFGPRVVLNTPRPAYQDESYILSPYTWRILGSSPLNSSITNATTLDVSFVEPVSETVIVSLIGPNDNGTDVREQLTFKAGEKIHRSIQRFTDLSALTKDKITQTDMVVVNLDGTTIASVPNSQFEARVKVVQITDKNFIVCNNCRCYDILYKKVTPYLYFDETYVPFEESLMAKTMEWILLPKDGQNDKANAFGEKARNLLVQFNGNERSTEHKMDLGVNKFNSNYRGLI